MTLYLGRTDGTVWVMDGDEVRPLPHHVRHSPTGFSWGYSGSGPADLARCLLLHALGDERWCSVCEGRNQIVYVHGEEMSIPRAEQEADEPGWQDNVYSCPNCEDGCAVGSAMYQRFKFDVVAALPMDQPWSMQREQVLEWHRDYVTRPSGKEPQEERKHR